MSLADLLEELGVAKDPAKQSGPDRIFYQQSHRLGSKRLLQNKSRLGRKLHRKKQEKNG